MNSRLTLVSCFFLILPASVWADTHLPDPYAYRANTVNELRRGFANPPKQAGPWVYWFWFANVVNREEITRELEEMAGAGIAGIELRCASMHGFERRSPGPWFNPDRWQRLNHRRYEYLSPTFVDILEHTLAEAQRLGLHFSMNLGMGWPPGGRWITEKHRSKHLVTATEVVQGPTSLTLAMAPDSRVSSWRCETDKTVIPESYLDLTEKVTPEGNLRWTGSGKLSFQHRRLPGADIYLLASWEEGFEGEVSFPQRNLKPEIWDADTGSMQVLKSHTTEEGRILIPCTLGKNWSRRRKPGVLLSWVDEWDVRVAAYQSLLAGACGHTYGDHSIWQM